MLIAKIVKSNSHVDYVGRVLDTLDGSPAPEPDHYKFGQFVMIKSAAPSGGNSNEGSSGSYHSVGIIYNSQLLNPDYDRLGPRLSSPVEINAVFSPDLLNEQGVLIGVLLVGWQAQDNSWRQGIARTVIPVNSEVTIMPDDQILAFHVPEGGKLALHYYPHVMTHARQFAQQLLLGVLDQLQEVCGDTSGAEIALLRRTLNWQLVFQNKSL
jgi:hypothetical protein